VGGQSGEETAEPPAVVAPPALARFTHLNVTFHFVHRVLEDFARDLASGLLTPLSEPVDVFVGVDRIPRPPDTGRLRIGIQTEQMLDQTGKRMWNVPKRGIRHALVTRYDSILDLSPDNRPAYRFLPVELRQKIRFGPRVFPDQELVADFVDAPPLFVGWKNERRRAILARLRSERPIVTLQTKLFGAELARKLAGQGAMLNVHFGEGVYTEVPRFLKACLAGKPVLSEPLGKPLIEGTHYLPLDAVLTEEAVEQLFAALRDLAAVYRFRSFLEGAIRGGKRS
jgi:hypothetical protein